jgi:serine/threonine protein kinase/Flp pilus assembly protein TadD
MSGGQDIRSQVSGWDESFPRPSLDSTSYLGSGPLAAGSQVGRFRIEGPLGQGGMGIVYLARDTKLNRFVAIKSLPPEIKSDASVRSRLQREAKLLAQLSHPNIATIYDQLEEIEGVIYLVLEYVAGRSLGDRIRDGRLGLAETLSIAAQTAAALAAAHEHGIIHRDLKPGNIMIGPQNDVKVLDFGLGKAMDAQTPGSDSPATKPGRVMGTVAYMSPELAMGKPADHRTDIWSLGVVIYEMLTGHPPFAGDTAQAVIFATLSDQPRSPRELREEVPMALEHVVLKMLQKDPLHRYESMQRVVVELQSLLQDCARLGASVEESASIAVLPFADMSPDGDREYFCDGMAEELINALTQIKGLRVIARTSAFSYKGKNLSIRHIGRELNVETILEGSVRWAGDRLRVMAQLIDAKRDHHLWSERYDRPAGDIFSIQDDITSAIVERLKPTLIEQESARSSGRRPVDLDAYHLYLKGCYFRAKGTPGSLAKAFEYFGQAAAKDPNCALAYVGLALSYSLLPMYNASAPAQNIAKAKEMISRALEIDETLPDAHGALGFIKTWYDWDWVGAERELRRAIEINPGSDRVRLWHAHYLMFQGRYDDARREVCQALSLDPISVVLNRELGMVSYFARDYDQAIDALHKTLEMDSSIMYAHSHLGAAYLSKSMYDEALCEFQKEEELAKGAHTWAATLDAITRVQMGRDAEARGTLDRLLERSKRQYVSPFHLGSIFLSLGQDDVGFRWLNTAYDGQDPWLCFLKALPVYDRIAADPRCTELLRKMKLE